MKETEFRTVTLVTLVCQECGEELSEDISESVNFEIMVCPKCGKEGNYKIRSIGIRQETR